MDSQQELAGIADIVYNFPEPKFPLFRRPNLVSALHNVFERGARFVTVEGPSGIGSTTFLSDFVRSFPQSSVALFIQAESSHGYDLEFLGGQLFEQLHWHLEAKLPDRDQIDSRLLRRAIFRAQRSLAREAPFYFVIDGLDKIPDRDVARAITTDLLPLALREFRFVFSGKADAISDLLPAGSIARPYELVPFSKDESRLFLAHVAASEGDLDKIYELTEGIPGRLASLMGAIKGGRTLEQLLSGRKDELIDFIRAECDRVRTLPEHLQETVAFIVHAKHPLSRAMLCAVLKSDETTFAANLEQLPFIQVTKSGEVRCASDAHRRYLSHVLEHLRLHVLDKLLELVLSSPDEQRDIPGLAPAYFAALGRSESLLQYLDDNKVSRILETCTSLRAVGALLAAGCDAAMVESAIEKLFRFVPLGAVVREAGAIGPMQAELDALIALGRKDKAVALALDAPLVEHRLALLSRFASLEKRAGNSIDATIREHIESLCAAVDFKDSDSLAVSIASDLIVVSPELALSLVERTAGQEGRKADWAFTALSVQSGRSHDSDGVLETLDGRAIGRIADKGLHSFALAASGLVDKMSASEVIGRAAPLGAEDKVFLLSCWARVNQRATGALDVIEAALDAMLKEQTFVPTLRDLRDLALPLRRQKDKDRVLGIVERFDGQKALARARSSAEDHVRLEMLLVEAERPWNANLADTRVSNLHSVVSNIREMSTKCDCLGWFVARAADIDPAGDIESRIGLFAHARHEWWETLQRVLANTGEHGLVVDAALRAFAGKDVDTACAVIAGLNTRSRRDECYQKVARLHARSLNRGDSVHQLERVIGCIESERMRERAVVRVLEAISDKSPECLSAIEGIETLIERLEGHVIAVDSKSAVWIWTLRILAKKGATSPLAERARAELGELLPRTEPEWLRFENYCHAIEATAKVWPDTANELAVEIEAMRRGARALTREISKLNIQAADLAARAFVALIAERKYRDQDLSSLDVLFHGCGDPQAYAMLWTQIAIWGWVRGDSDLCRRVSSDYLWPAIKNAKANCEVVGASAFIEAGAALFIAHPTTMLAELSRLAREQREDAVNKAIYVLLSRQPPSEPFEGRGKARGFRVTSETANDVAVLAEHLERDSDIYWAIDVVVHAILGEEKARITAEQREDLRTRFARVIAKRLPDLGNIKHEGYVVVSEAALLALKGNARGDEWNVLIARAAAIENLSDKAFCLAEIALYLPSRMVAERKRAIEDIKAALVRIPADVDRCCRYDVLASNFEAEVPDFSRECASAGLQQSFLLEDALSIQERQERFIEALYRADERMAEKLVTSLDKDPARADAKWRLSNALEAARVKKALRRVDERTEWGEKEKRHASDAAWSQLGLVNAGAQAPLDVTARTRLAGVAAHLPMRGAYPILALIVQSAVARMGGEREVARTGRPMFEALSWVAMAAHIVARRLATSHPSWPKETWQGGALMRARDGERARSTVLAALSRMKGAEQLFVCDPYFGPQDLWIAREIGKISPESEVVVVTGRVQVSKAAEQVEQEYETEWRELDGVATSQAVSIVHCWFEDDSKPYIHDRWIVGGKCGIRLGSSLNAIGGARVFEVSSMVEEDAVRVRGLLEDVSLRRIRVEDGRRIRVRSITL